MFVLSGGGVYGYDMNLELMSTVISSNNCANQGDGVYLFSGSATIVGCLFSGNNIGNEGDDIYNDSCAAVVTVLSNCPEDFFNNGANTLMYACETAAADLLSGQCSACSGADPYACCGATVCTSTEQTCTDVEYAVCSDTDDA